MDLSSVHKQDKWSVTDNNQQNDYKSTVPEVLEESLTDEDFKHLKRVETEHLNDAGIQFVKSSEVSHLCYPVWM